MKGHLEKLQSAVLERLSLSGEFPQAALYAQSGADETQSRLTDGGMRIIVSEATPAQASEFAASPAFSKVAISVSVEADYSVYKGCKSLTAAAERVSNLLHFWCAPAGCGYSRLALEPSKPWHRPQLKAPKAAICVNFTASAAAIL